MDELSRNLVNIDPNVFPAFLPTAYQVQPPFIFNQTGIIDIEAWKNKPRRYSQKYPEGKIHTTKDGWKVRSKSEVFWADGYSDAGIPYVYEAILRLLEIDISTDFTALCVRRDLEIPHEHNGKMDDANYFLNTFLPRLNLYLKAGYVPNDTLLLTFETKDCPLTSEIVQKTLEQFFY